MKRKKRALEGLDNDIRDHIERETQENIERGMTPEEARRQALLKFGSVALAKEDTRAVWGWPSWDAIRQDIRYALRTLRKNPAFALVVVLTLGFGIGISTATFSLVNAALIRPLGFPEPERLLALQEYLWTGATQAGPFSPSDYLDLEREQKSFEGVAAYTNVAFELSGAGDPVRVDAAKVTASLFSVLRTAPAVGRAFAADEDRPGADVAILSWGLWQRRYGGRPEIVGQTITLDRRPFAVVGVMPAGFEFPRRGPAINNKPASVWVPMAFLEGQRQARGNQYNHGVIARLKDGVTLGEARAELNVLGPLINSIYPADLRNAGFSIRLSATPLHEEISGRVERPLLWLLAAVGLVLLVTCANVANLVLARAASRTREIAVRTALGSSRGRLLQMLLGEAAVLSVAGGLLGVLISRAVLAAVPAVVTETLPTTQDISLDFRVLAFAAGIAMATSILFALIPLVTVDRGVPGAALQEEVGRTTLGRRRHRLQAGLVVSTVGLACVLLVGAGLFTRSLSAVMETDAGFDPEQVLTASLTLPRAGYSTAASVRTFHNVLFTRASALPGVRSAALVTDLPLEQYERRILTAEASDTPRSTNLSWVSGPYFQTLGIRLKSGREFTEVENAQARLVVVINEKLARALWPGEEAVGKRLRWGIATPDNSNPWLMVVGVVADVADGPLGDEPFFHSWEPFSQFPDAILNNFPNAFGRHVKLAVRTQGDPRAFASTIRAEVGNIDRQLALESVSTMHDRLRESTGARRFSAMTLGGFATGSLLLAAIGLYGLLAYHVRERRREIAVRLALGAEPPAILRMVVTQGLKLVVIGLLFGGAASYAVARAVASLLYQTKSHDPVTFGAVPIVLLGVALVASAIPAYRASRVEATVALKAE